MTSIAGGVLMFVAAAAIVVLTFYLVRMARQLTGAAAEIESVIRTLNESTLPRIERVLDQTQAELGELRGATQAAERIAGTVQDVVNRAQTAIMPALDTVSDVALYVKQVSAVVHGLRAGWGALRRPHRS
jgi:uncharacterized protein YoxC